MVQDTSPSPEMYIAKRPNGGCGGWGLTDSTNEGDGVDIDYANLRECYVVWAVNIPGESAWCADELDGPIATACTSVVTKIPYSSFHD